MFRKLRVMASALKRLLLAHNLFLYEAKKVAVKALLMDTLVNERLYVWPPSENPVFLNPP